MGKTPIKTKKEEIVRYWFFEQLIDECGLSIDAAEAHERCWRCGYKSNLERCHIVPESLGGKDEPSNLVLLCHRCHLDNPNIADPEIIWDWIRAYGVPCYDTFWDLVGSKEYEFIYNRSFYSELIDFGIKDPVEANRLIKLYLPEIFEKVGYHYGHPYMNTATIAGVYRIIIKRIAKEHNKELKDFRNIPHKPWYYPKSSKETNALFPSCQFPLNIR